MNNIPFVNIFIFVLFGLIFSGCNSNIFNARAKKPYRYELNYGESVILRNGYAVAPRHAPPAVHRIVAAGNRIKGLPYKLGLEVIKTWMITGMIVLELSLMY